ncbi:AraC family transcriptional regulator [Chloroflexi bacterium TSY]|nr:AraC family transcriptional regulator [Chloroflexi bacterium TSY]
MRSYSYRPGPPLSNFIELMWFYDDYYSSHQQEYAIPHGAATLVINFALREATFCGAHSQPFLLQTEKMVSHIGICFKPAGAFPFLDLPANELHNEVVSLDTLWGSQVFSVRDQLLEAPTAHAKFRILESVLLTRLQRPHIIHPAIAFAVDAFSTITRPRPVAAVAEQVGLGMRRFHQIFDAQVGLSPKRFHRVQRFQQVLSQIYGNEEVNWADVAYRYGYVDQAHLIHEFQQLSSVTPTVYLANAIRHMNHVIVDCR